MKSKSCPICGTPMKKNGFTSSGKQRWRCKNCGVSQTHSKDNASIRLKKFYLGFSQKNPKAQCRG